MSAILKVFTDSAHTSEVAHTTLLGTTIQTGHAALVGDTTLFLTSVTGAPVQGMLDIIDGANNELAIPFYGLSGNQVQLALTSGLAHAHAAGVTVNVWFYQLAVGDQTNGIPNDGTEAAPAAGNTANWWLYNAGDQTAQSPTLATASGAPSTASGFADTLISITSGSAGFAASVSPSNIAAGATQEFWVVAEVPSGQSIAGNPQVCQLNITYSSI